MNSKPGIKSKTLIINYIVLLGAFMNELSPVIQDSSLSRIAIVMAVANIILRYMTKSAIKSPFTDKQS